MISIENVSKYFGTTQALNQVSFKIEPGEIVGFVGQNGAGKTTLMRILTTYCRASSGTVLIDGEDAAKNSLAIRRKIGYLPETPPLYPNMTVRDYLNFAAEIREVPANDRRRQLSRANDMDSDTAINGCEKCREKEKTIAAPPNDFDDDIPF